MIIKAINNLFLFYYVLIILRIFLTWVPSIRWDEQPFKALREVTDLYLDLFRRFIPPMGGLDISPIIALIVLQIIQSLIVGILSGIVS